MLTHGSDWMQIAGTDSQGLAGATGRKRYPQPDAGSLVTKPGVRDVSQTLGVCGAMSMSRAWLAEDVEKLPKMAGDRPHPLHP